MFKFINKVKNKEYSKEKGFSLLELSVAVGIAAIVGAAGIVATTGFIGSAETKKDNYVANAERAIAEAESSSLALGETGSTGGGGSSEGTEEEETPPAPGAPTTVLASDIISTGATLTWAAPETGEVGEYIVTLNGDVQGSEPIPNNVFSYVFTGLTVNTYYEAKVFAKSPGETLSEAATTTFISEFKPTFATGGDITQTIQDSTEKSYIVHRFTSDGTFTLNVTDADPNGEDLKFTIDGVGSSFGGATTQGTRPVAEENITVVVDNGGRVDVAYPQDNQTNDITFETINPVPISATGGSISNVTIDGTKYRTHTFTSTGTSTFTVSTLGNINNGAVDFLIVGGGGGGGGYGGGGGGSAVIHGEGMPITAGSYSVVVGAGGSGRPGIASPSSSQKSESYASQFNGGNSSVFGLSATGGGAGGAYNNLNAGNGGNGGGTGAYGSNTSAGGSSPGVGVAPAGNQYTTVYAGNTGGTANTAAPSYPSAGGAGAGENGGSQSSGSGAGGSGGDGVLIPIDGNNYYYGGGGGGSRYASNSGGNGGLGGGGGGAGQGTGGGQARNSGQNAGSHVNNGGNGGANTGGGGGGGNYGSAPGATASPGGSGIVIIRYALEPVSGGN